MPLVLDVDGKRTSEPSAADIAEAFNSLDKRASGWLSGPGLSLITLERGAANSLTATGTYAQGFLLSHQDGDSASEFNSDPARPISAVEVISVFQAYARCDEDWRMWERYVTTEKTSNILKRLLMFGLIALGVYLVILGIAKWAGG